MEVVVKGVLPSFNDVMNWIHQVHVVLVLGNTQQDLVLAHFIPVLFK